MKHLSNQVLTHDPQSHTHSFCTIMLINAIISSFLRLSYSSFPRFPEVPKMLYFLLSDWNPIFSVLSSSGNTASTTILDLEPLFGKDLRCKLLEALGTGRTWLESWVFSIICELEISSRGIPDTIWLFSGSDILLDLATPFSLTCSTFKYNISSASETGMALS